MIDKFSFISNILNILALWILSGKIGTLGTTYAILSLQCFLLLWTFLGSSVTEGLGRLLRSRNQKGQYRSAKNAMLHTLFTQSVLGLAGSCIVLFSARFFANSILHIPYMELLLTLTAPTLFFRSINAVLLGNFRGNGDYLVETVVHFVRPMGLLLFGNWFCGILAQHGSKISTLLQTEEVLSMYCGAGIVLAIVMTEAILLPILILLYRFKRHSYVRQIPDGLKMVEKKGRFLGVFYCNSFFTNIVRLFMRLPYLAMVLMLLGKTEDISNATIIYGDFVIVFLVSCGISGLLIGLMLVPNYTKFENYYRKEEKRYIKSTFQSGLCSIFVWGCFLSVMVACLAEPLAEKEPQLLMLGALLILFTNIGYYLSRMLLICGKRGYLVISLLLTNGLYFTLSAVVTSGKMEDAQNILLVLGLLTMAYCVISGYIVFRHIKLGVKWMTRLLVPLAGNCVIGLIVFLLSKGMFSLFGSVFTVLLSLIIACALYLGVLLLWKRLLPQEPDEIIGGKNLHRIGEKFHIF